MLRTLFGIIIIFAISFYVFRYFYYKLTKPDDLMHIKFIKIKSFWFFFFIITYIVLCTGYLVYPFNNNLIYCDYMGIFVWIFIILLGYYFLTIDVPKQIIKNKYLNKLYLEYTKFKEKYPVLFLFIFNQVITEIYNKSIRLFDGVNKKIIYYIKGIKDPENNILIQGFHLVGSEMAAENYSDLQGYIILLKIIPDEQLSHFMNRIALALSRKNFYINYLDYPFYNYVQATTRNATAKIEDLKKIKAKKGTKAADFEVCYTPHEEVDKSHRFLIYQNERKPENLIEMRKAGERDNSGNLTIASISRKRKVYTQKQGEIIIEKNQNIDIEVNQFEKYIDIVILNEE